MVCIDGEVWGILILFMILELIKFPLEPPSMSTVTGIPYTSPWKVIRSDLEIAPKAVRDNPVDPNPLSPLLVSCNSWTSSTLGVIALSTISCEIRSCF